MAKQTLITSKNGELERLEKTVEKGLSLVSKGNRVAGPALLEIHRKGHYKKAGYKTWEKYCQERWGFSKSRAYQLIDAEKLKERLSTIVDKVPATESHLREIAKAPEDKQAAIVAEVIEQCEAEKREPTAKDYKKAVKEIGVDDIGTAEPQPLDEPTQEFWSDDPEDYEDVEDEPQASIVADRNGFPIPANLKPAYELRLAWDEVIKEIRHAKLQVSRLAKQKGGEWVSASITTKDLQQVIYEIGSGVFGEVCRECSGKGCEKCQQLGYQPEGFGKQ